MKKRVRKPVKKPAASVKPGSPVIMDKKNEVAEFIRTFGVNEYRWIQLCRVDRTPG